MKIPYGRGFLELPLEDLLGKPDLLWTGQERAGRVIDPGTVLKKLGKAETCLVQENEVPEWEPLYKFFLKSPQRPVLVVPDATRKGFWQDILPSLAGGLWGRWPDTVLTLLVATGIHAVVPKDDIEQHLRFAGPPAPPPEHPYRKAILAGRIRIVQHRSDAGNSPVGTTKRGTLVSLDQTYLESDARILLGGTSFHYFAGFGGGPKLVFPGLAERSGILKNHLRALDREKNQWNAACAPARIIGNPVAEDIAEAASLAPPHAAVFTLRAPDQTGVVTMAKREDWQERFHRCQTLFHDWHRLNAGSKLNGIVADAGGEPRDRHLLQVHKSLQHAVQFLTPNGWVLLIGECREGIGSNGLLDMMKAIRRHSLSEISNEKTYAGHLQTAVALRAASENRKIGFFSKISQEQPQQIRELGWEPLSSVTDVADWLIEQPKGSWGRVSEADTVLPN